MYTTAGIKTNISKPRIDSLQGLRAIAFLAIFTSHAGIGSFGALGAWGVSVFIIMSGFLLTYNYFDREIEKPIMFSIKKIGKLYQLYVVMLLSALILELYSVIHTSAYSNLPIIFAKTIADLMLVQSWIPKSDFYFSLNSVSWYLSVAIFLYLSFPYLLRIIRKYRTCFAAVIGIVAVILIQVALSVVASVIGNEIASSWFSQHWMTCICPIYRVCDFFVGCSLGYIFINSKKKNTGTIVITVFEIATFALIIVACIVFASGKGILGSEAVKYTILFAPMSAAAVLLMGRNAGYVSKLLGAKPFVLLGDLSSYTFLIHLMVIKYFGAVLSFANLQMNAVVQAIIALIITIVAAKMYQMLYVRVHTKNLRRRHENTCNGCKWAAWP